jgi:outer membrane protein OmpA-like peptidoglycan-associated protein
VTEIDMDARLASGVLVALGFADVAAANLLLTPRLAAPQGMSAPAARPDCPPPPIATRVEAAPLPAPASPEAASTAPARSPADLSPASGDVIFELGDERVGSILATNEIKRVAGELAADPARRLALRGHTDRLGTPAQNLALSRRRAEAIRRLLMAFGAPEDRISIEAAGDAEPADASDTPRGWARNRRVQLFWR